MHAYIAVNILVSELVVLSRWITEMGKVSQVHQCWFFFVSTSQMPVSVYGVYIMFLVQAEDEDNWFINSILIWNVGEEVLGKGRVILQS